MAELVENRSEILFLYDVTDANPNGDPVDENKPRIDEETGINIVTDVRLKRTIRDYLYNFKSNSKEGKRQFDIFVREIVDEEGHIQDAKLRAKDFLKDVSTEDLKKKSLQEQKKMIEDEILKNCIDIRLFGATIPIELEAKKSKKSKKAETGEQEESKVQTSSLTYTGPVQFKLGRSLHKVSMQYIKGTGAFASAKGAEQKTFREEYILPYSLITFYGVTNENAAKTTRLTEDDVKLLLDAIWNGTKNLISRSKAGQMPRLLMQVLYKSGDYHIGELDKRISLIKNDNVNNDEEIRDISQVKIDISGLASAMTANKDKIEKILFKADDRTRFLKDGKEVKIELALGSLKVENLPF